MTRLMKCTRECPISRFYIWIQAVGFYLADERHLQKDLNRGVTHPVNANFARHLGVNFCDLFFYHSSRFVLFRLLIAWPDTLQLRLHLVI